MLKKIKEINEKQKGVRFKSDFKAFLICFAISAFIGFAIQSRLGVSLSGYRENITIKQEDFIELKDVVYNKIIKEDGFDNTYVNKNLDYNLEIKNCGKIDGELYYEVILSKDIHKFITPEITVWASKDFQVQNYNYNYDSLEKINNKAFIFFLCYEVIVFMFFVVVIFWAIEKAMGFLIFILTK